MHKKSTLAAATRAAHMIEAAAVAGRVSLTMAEEADLLAAFGLVARAPAPEMGVIRVGLLVTRDFGPVLSAGAGGIDAELAATGLRQDPDTVFAVAELTDDQQFFEQFQRTMAWRKLVRLAEIQQVQVPASSLRGIFAILLMLAARDAERLLELSIDLAVCAGELQATGVRCEIGCARAARQQRPIHKIDKLLHPKSIGIIGVSATAMNFGRIILHNLVDSGYPKAQLRIIRPGEPEIDGVRCVEGLRALDGKLDLLIVAVPSEAVYALVDEIIETDAVESVMLIPGGLGETEKSREPARVMAEKINAAHANPGGGPVFLGANCLGVVSHPGAYDSWFIPLERLPKPQKKPERNSVLISQSGAFMITRLSQNPWLDPRYMLALGNQTDLTHGDMMCYFAERPEIETIGVYIEGFKDGDGLAFAKAVRRAVLNGKQVVIYKSGQSAAGAAGVMGHTASIAGDPVVFDAVLRHAGAIVAEDFNSFDDLFYIAGALHHKHVGLRLGAISGAGFEAVGMADASVGNRFSMQIGKLEVATVARVREVLAAKKLDALVEVRNPIDINPGADDEAHLAIVEAFAADPNIDAVVVGLDPTAPAVRALAESRKRPGFDIHDAKSTVHLMPPLVDAISKPIIGIVDGGRLYDAMAAGLMDRGVCVFRNCARGTRALVRYTEARQQAESLRIREQSIQSPAKEAAQ